MKISTFTKLSLIALSLSACGKAGGDDDTNNTGTSTGTSQSDYEAYNSAHDGIVNEDVVGTSVALGESAADARSDTVKMNGVYGITVGDLLPNDPIVGKMSMTANFGNDTVTGKLNDSFLLLTGDPDEHTEDSAEPLSGSMTHVGTITGDQLSSHFDGILTRTDGTQYDLYVDMDGGFYTINDGELVAIGNFEGNLAVIGDSSGTLYDIDNGLDFVADDENTNDTGFVVCESLCNGN